MELMHSFCIDNVLVDLLESILFYSGDTYNVIHRKDIEFNPEPHEGKKKSSTVQGSNASSHDNSLNQLKI